MKQRDRILKILQETRKELFPSLKRLADINADVLRRLGGSGAFLPKEFVDEMMNSRNHFKFILLWQLKL